MSAIEQTGEAIVITDTAGAMQYVNPAFERITGYTRLEALGHNLRILLSDEQDATLYDQMWDTLQEGKVWNGRFINQKKDGTHYTVDATLSPVQDTTGAVINYVAVKRDITESLRLNQEKEKLEEHYHQSQKVESIGRLAGGVAHDLNNLLTPILGYSELLLEDSAVEGDQRVFAGEILRSGGKARDLVGQLLAFSRKQTLQYKPVDLDKAVAGFEQLLRRTIREDIEIVIIPSPTVNSVMADIVQIEQVIMNLAVNASDAMPGGGTLTIETAALELDEGYTATHPEAKPGSYVMLAFSDTGEGMDEETRLHLFEPFYSTKGDQGTGLGLATVYGIVKQHEGNIWVYSERGKGTTFKVYLPLAEEASVEEQTSKAIPTDLTGDETILLVEDNEQVRRLTHDILRRQGYVVLVAENGPEALTILEAQENLLDLLLTDVVMPRMNGKELYERCIEKSPWLKVLYMSGYTDEVIAHRGVLDEGVALIQKPFTVPDLAAKVREVLDRDSVTV